MCIFEVGEIGDLYLLGQSVNAFSEDNILASILSIRPNNNLLPLERFRIKLDKETTVVAIDEAQFIDDGIVDVVNDRCLLALYSTNALAKSSFFSIESSARSHAECYRQAAQERVGL